MGKRIRDKWALFLCVIIGIMVAVPVSAATIPELEQQKKDHESQLNRVTGQISEMEDEQAILEEEISDLDSEVINMFTSISLLEDEITDKQGDITVTEGEIAQAQADYEEAQATEQEQYESMKIRIQYMYEQGDDSYLQLFLEADNFGDMLNKAGYIEQLYEYDRRMLLKYQEAKESVELLRIQLEEKHTALVDEKSRLEASKKELEDQRSYLNGLLEKKKKQSENYETQIAQAKQQAAVYKTKIKEEQAQIKKIQEEERRRREEEERRKKEEEALAANDKKGQGSSQSGGPSGESGKNSGSSGSSGSTGGTANAGGATGSALGQKIADYACQYVGYPYVSGGTSLTNGADCSGFTYRVYSDFGYSIPRTSYAQQNAGTGVDLSNAQPGDIVCYPGHVGIYIGNGSIVHASTQKTGIKISNVNYRPVTSVRRIIS